MIFLVIAVLLIAYLGFDIIYEDLWFYSSDVIFISLAVNIRLSVLGVVAVLLLFKYWAELFYYIPYFLIIFIGQ